MNHCFDKARKNKGFWEEKLNGLQERIGYRFKNPALLREAMTHSSFRHETGLDQDNERLEYVGDAVLQLLVTEALVDLFPLANEGELTRRRSALVCEESLLKQERNLDLFSFLRIGKGVEKMAVRGTMSMRADAVEALIGAIYLDGGLIEVQRFFTRVLLPHADFSASDLHADPKSALQEHLQQCGKPVPEYVLIEKSGQDDVPNFVVGILSAGQVLATGSGHSKKEAEFAAARAALEAFD
jgi:ribonuclease-3